MCGLLYPSSMELDWQSAAVIVIEALAIVFLVRRLAIGRRGPARPASKPDVSASALRRK